MNSSVHAAMDQRRVIGSELGNNPYEHRESWGGKRSYTTLISPVQAGAGSPRIAGLQSGHNGRSECPRLQAGLTRGDGIAPQTFRDSCNLFSYEKSRFQSDQLPCSSQSTRTSTLIIGPAMFVFLWSTAGSLRAQTDALIVSPPSRSHVGCCRHAHCVEVANRRLRMEGGRAKRVRVGSASSL